MLIDIIGIDGAGKSTQAKLLKKRIENDNVGKNVIVCNVLSNKLLKNKLLLLIEKCKEKEEDYYELGIAVDLYRAYNYMTEDVYNLLDKGSIVILEKSFVDAIVFLSAFGMRNSLAVDLYKTLLKPDFTVCLDIDPNEAYRRITNRAYSTFKPINAKEKLSLLSLARDNYVSYCNANCISTINAEQCELVVNDLIYKKISELLC